MPVNCHQHSVTVVRRVDAFFFLRHEFFPMHSEALETSNSKHVQVKRREFNPCELEVLSYLPGRLDYRRARRFCCGMCRGGHVCADQ